MEALAQSTTDRWTQPTISLPKPEPLGANLRDDSKKDSWLQAQPGVKEGP